MNFTLNSVAWALLKYSKQIKHIINSSMNDTQSERQQGRDLASQPAKDRSRIR